MTDDPIKSYFAFDDSDLLANQNGLLSENQSKRIKAADQFGDRVIMGLLLVFLAGGIVLGSLALEAGNNIGLWTGTVIMLFLVLWAFRSARTDVDDTVQKVQGKINFVKVEKQTGSVGDASSKRLKAPRYEMHINGEVFAEFSPAVIEYMQDGTYAVYFTKSTRQILSVEALSDGNNSAEPIGPTQ